MADPSLPALLACLLAPAIIGCATASIPATVTPSPTFEGVDPDIAAGYAKYRDALAADGTWKDDFAYGARWCPRQAAFEPYRTQGRWAALPANEAAKLGVASGTITWDSRGPAWVDITHHHGWWAQSDERDDREGWCWIPGAEATTARVVWRRGNGLAAWAPEPPLGHVERGSEDDLAWRFVLLGALLEPELSRQLLTTEAREQAAVALSEASPDVSREGPRAAAVQTAHDALAGHLRAARPPGVKASGEQSSELPGADAMVLALEEHPMPGRPTETPSFVAGLVPAQRARARSVAVNPPVAVPRSAPVGQGASGGSLNGAGGIVKLVGLLLAIPFQVARIAAR